jgi:hypothetical protein
MFHYRTVAVGIPIESAYHGALCEEALFFFAAPQDLFAPLIAMTLLPRSRHRDVRRSRRTVRPSVSNKSGPAGGTSRTRWRQKRVTPDSGGPLSDCSDSFFRVSMR